MCDCRYIDLIVLSSQYGVLVFVVVMHCLFVFEQFIRRKYIRLKIIYQINSHQYVTELES